MPEGGGPTIPIKSLDAPKENKAGYGIFWTVQEFDGPRVKENLCALNGFAVDIDTPDKSETLKKIKKGLLPTWLIETKNGYHVYWLFPDPMLVQYSEELETRYRSTMQNRLVPFYEADVKARDLCRILRAPYFLHQKDPKNPFMISVTQENDFVRYSWSQIDRFYDDMNADREWEGTISRAARELKIPKSGGFFDKVFRLNAISALEILSGTPEVGGDVYAFSRTASGGFNIISNGKGTSCWVDSEGHIGSLDKGGPTIWQWLYWYQRDHKAVYQTMRKYFSGLFE
jgi:hypothetical protein